MSKLFQSKEQKQFCKRIEKHIERLDAPLLLEGGTGLGKTRAYLAAIAPYKNLAIVLPTHQLIDQLLASSDIQAVGLTDVRAFRPAGYFSNKEEAIHSNEAARNAQIMLCTSASVIIDQRMKGEYNGVTRRDYIIFDEADQFPQAAALQSDLSISAIELKEAGVKLTNLQQTLEEIIVKPARSLAGDLRARAQIMRELSVVPAWYFDCGLDGDGGLVLSHKLPGRLLKKISNQPNVAFISATLSVGGSFHSFKKAMGIESESVLSEKIEPLEHGTLRFHTSNAQIETTEWINEVIQTIKDSPKPTLVATTSHELSRQLAVHLPHAVVRTSEESTALASLRVDQGGVLISAGAWAGLDLPIQWKSIVIPRIPFSRPVSIDQQVVTHYIDVKDTATRRMRQVIGRGLRSPDAACNIYIMDGRYVQIDSFVPVRFANAWANRKQISVGLPQDLRGPTTLEQDPMLRKSVIGKYGRICQCCGVVPKLLQDLYVIDNRAPSVRGDFHLADSLLLCKSCRDFAYAEGTPITLSYLQSLLKK